MCAKIVFLFCIPFHQTGRRRTCVRCVDLRSIAILNFVAGPWRRPVRSCRANYSALKGLKARTFVNLVRFKPQLFYTSSLFRTEQESFTFIVLKHGAVKMMCRRIGLSPTRQGATAGSAEVGTVETGGVWGIGGSNGKQTIQSPVVCAAQRACTRW